jgi:hypothetical protein
MTSALGLAMTSLAIWPPRAFAQDTPNQQRACRPDVARFCRHVEGGGDAIRGCLRANVERLRPACREVIEGLR